MLPHQLSPGHYISNGSEGHGGDEGDLDGDERVAEIVVDEEVVVVVDD